MPSKTTWFAILALIAVGQLEAQVPRRAISDGPPSIPEPVDGKVHGDDYHHEKKPVEMSKEATEVAMIVLCLVRIPFMRTSPTMLRNS